MPGGRPKKTKILNLKRKNDDQLDIEVDNIVPDCAGPSRTTRLAKVKAIKKTTETMKVLNDCESREMHNQINKINKRRRTDETDDNRSSRLDTMRQYASRRRKSETNEEHLQRLQYSRQQLGRKVANETAAENFQRLGDLRQRAVKRIATEAMEERTQRLDNMRQRTSHRIANETAEESSQRLENMRQRTSQRVANETADESLQRLEDLRQRASKRIATEAVEERTQRLENMRQRTFDRVANETMNENSQRLEDLRQRASKRIATEATEERTQRLENMRQRTSQRVANESANENSQRLEDLRQRASKRIATETIEERTQRLENMRQCTSQRVANETADENSQRLEDLRQRASKRIATEAIDERTQRLENIRLRTSQRVANETAEEKSNRLENLRQRASERIANETAEENRQRLEYSRQCFSERIATEAIEERTQRLENMRERATQRLAGESNENREQRLEEQRRRNTRRLRALEQNQLPTYKSAVESNVEYQCLGSFNIECIHCKAIHFPEERVSNPKGRNSFGDCYLRGRIEFEPPKFSNELARLFLRRHPFSEEFHKRIRNINSSFALASFNVKDDRTINSYGIYSFIACGQIYHKMNMAAHPTQNAEGEFERPQYGQIYFLDSENAVSERLNHPLNHGISRPLMELLEEIIRSQNSFAQAYLMMREVEETVNQRAAEEGIPPPQVKLLFTLQEGTDTRRYNIPTSNEVCAVLTLQADQSFPENEMVVHQRGRNIRTLKNSDERVEPFTYPMFYPKGTFGFSLGVKLKTPYVRRQTITRLEFAQYRLAFRSELARCLPSETLNNNADFREVNFNALHFGGRLFQQYLVDTYIRVERDRIHWIKTNQKKILADQYTSVSRFINELAEKKNAAVGEKIILPSSFIGSTRYYEESFEDAMAIVYRLGSPDFFITMTSNPEWPELKEASRIAFEDGITLQQLSQDRPDLVARISKLKFDSFITDLDKNQIFGKVAAYVYTIEFQKRGLPHMHLLLIMAPEDKIHNPEEIDDFISAEIPNNDDPELRHLVLKWMIHNPCGELNPSAPCMINKNRRMKCRFDYPKEFQEVTSLMDDEKPKYRRRYEPKLDQRSSEFSHEDAVYRKDVNNRRITRDNRHVAPFNAYLLKKYSCHINVEYVGSIRAVKYLYKYIYKGHDCASIKIVEEQRRLFYNEADTFVEGRCITPPEACWRLFGNEIQKKSHSVQRLDIHLPGQYRMSNIDQGQEDLADIGQKGSTLEAYFRHNRALKETEQNNTDANVVYYHYWKIPEHYRWVGSSSKWVERIRRTRVIGRIHNVNFIAQPELYHLRVLLFHVKDATSFEDLLTVNGIQHTTYKQACLARGLAFDDQQWIEGLRESALSKSPRAMRILFAQILIFGVPENPKRLWDMFKADLAEDFIREQRRIGGSNEEAFKRAYRIIAHKLNTEATEGRRFQHWVQEFGMDDIEDVENQSTQCIARVDESAAIGEDLFRLLKGRQTQIVNKVIQAASDINPVPKCFFIDGPGGTGKTFIYKTIFHILNGRSLKVQCMAFTGIASILLPNGQTAHKTFGLKVPLSSDSISNIKPGSRKAKSLSEVDVFLMDEAPMLPKYGLQNMDDLLRSIANPNLPFGGKVMVLGGDFRQCLPVQPRANRSELLDLSIKQSELWHHFVPFSLVENMRVDAEEKQFADYLLKLGNGDLHLNAMEEIELPQEIISNGNLIDEVFGNCLGSEHYESMKDRAILAPLNKDVNKINTTIIDKLPGDYKIHLSCDSVKNQPEGELQFTTEFLNSIDIADLPPHKLKLKKNTIIMMMRNLDVSEGLCNGTRLIVTELCNNIIKAKIITGEQSGREVHIPRITLDSNRCQLGCVLQRHQFPVKPAFAITIHKAQGQTFDFVGVDLQVPVFMHGMLYVAFSRVKRESSLRILLPKETPCHTRNIVWKEILNTAQQSNEEIERDIAYYLEELLLDDF